MKLEYFTHDNILCVVQIITIRKDDEHFNFFNIL